MRILELRLMAFGPFTDKVIDLSQGDNGLHVIYGPNEAGKSSALRAMRQMLYGIPERSTDGFVHPYDKMRIGALIQHKNGDVLEYIRRKGRTNTLRAVDDKTVIDEAAIQQFLNGVDEDFFVTMFGIDHVDLVRGGEEIVAGGGTMGQVIFAAGSGVVNLREIQQDLQSKADLLFRPSGQKPQINEILGSLNKNRKELGDAQLPGQEWAEHDQALRGAQARIQAVNERLSEKQRDRHRLERIKEALPVIARRREFQEDHKNYASAVLLPDHFRDQRRNLSTKLSIAESDHKNALQNIDTLKKEAAGLDVPTELLENAEFVEEVHQDLGSHRKAAKDRIERQTQKNVLRAEAKEILRGLRDDLDLGDAAKLRIKKADRITIRELGSQFERIITRSENAPADISKIGRQIADIEEQLKALDEPKSIDQLKSVAEQAAEYGVLEKTCCEDQIKIKNDVETLEIQMGRQSLWSGTVEKIEGLSVPRIETVDAFEDRLAAAEKAASDLKSENKKRHETLTQVDRQIEELQGAGKVPTEKDLHDSRNQREHGWRLIRNTLEGSPAPEEDVQCFIRQYPPSSILAEAYEAGVSNADEISDRLRREADRVAVLANLLAAKTAHEKQAEDLKKELDGAEKKLTEISDEWKKMWQPAGIEPRTPREMRGWLQDHKAMSEKAAEIRERRTETDALQTTIGRHRSSMNKCLQALAESAPDKDESLADVVKRARKIAEKQEELNSAKKQLLNEKTKKKKELADAQKRVEQSEKELAEWKKQWEQAVRPLGLDAGAKPAQANAVMEDLQSFFEKLNEADTLQKRINGIDRDATEFTNKVVGLIKTVARDLEGMPVDHVAIELNSRLRQAQTIRTKMQAIEQQLEKENKRERQAAKKIADIKTLLNVMCKEASCKSYEDLPEAEHRSKKRQQIESDLENFDEQLLKLSAGTTVENFVKEALKEDPDAVDNKIQSLTEEIDKLTDEKSELNQTIGREETELSKMDGGARAAGIAEETQMLLGRLEHDIEQYARLRIASAVLNQAIERYRKKNQGPILKRANSFFAQLTQGSFEGIRADFDYKGQPVIVGVRSDGKEIVTVAGMSDGTADQLYLALRLAGLGEYLEKNEPIPFIVDDILIRFDNNRAVATLKILAELSKKTQVIFFTHHKHLVDLAEKNCDSTVLINHSLSA